MRIEIINTKTLQLLLALVGLLTFASAPAAPKDFELHQAVLDNNLPLVSKFLSKGADIDLIGSRKYGYGSALHLAVREGHLDIAQLLLERGAQVDVLDPDDFTPLHNAAWNGNLEMTQLLLDAGADIEASTYDGDTPLTLAQNNDQPRVAEFIQAKLEPSPTSGAKVESPTSSDPGVIDISGTYVADITGPITKLIKDRSRANQIVKIERNGDIFIGSFDDGRGKLYVEIEGDEFKFDWHAWSAGGKGSWTLKPGSKDLVGTWYKTGGTVGHTGKWNLTKIEAEPAQAVDVSGTYTPEISYDFRSHLHRWYFGKKPNIEITLEQNDDVITGIISGNRSGDIKGVIKGNKITYELNLGDIPADSDKHGKGSWLVGDDGVTLRGPWQLSSTEGFRKGQWRLTKTDVEAAPVPDISGTYAIAELTYPSDVNRSYYRWYFGTGKDLKMTIEQSGEVVSGTFSGEVKGEFKGAIKDKEITFDYDSVAAGSSRYGSGVLMVSDDSTELVGTFLMKGVSSGSFTGNWKFRKTEAEPAQAVDVTGTYMADLMGTNTGGQEGTAPWRKRKNSNREVKLLQKGKQVTGSFNGGKGSIFGEIDGNTIEFDWATGGGGNGKGKWTVKPDSKTLVGTWYCLVCTTARDGKWILTKIKSTPPSSLSGTYHAQFSGTGMRTVQKDQSIPIEITIVQNGNEITGTVEGGTRKEARRKIYGDIDGYNIKYFWDYRGCGLRGNLTISPSADRMTGTWGKSGCNINHGGTWTLTRVE